MKNAVIAALAVSIAVGVSACVSRTMNEDVRVCPEPLLVADCAVLLAARDTLAGDGELNWSADVPLTEWEGVTVSGTPRRVTGLDLRNRGLTGTIPPELGNLPPTLATLRLAGNAFTGCVPERLRLATANDLEALIAERGLPWCPVAAMPFRETALAPGTYQVDGTLIVDIPAGDPRVNTCGTVLTDPKEPVPGEPVPEVSDEAVCFSDLDGVWEMWLDLYYAVEWSRYSPDTDMPDDAIPAGLDAVFDAIAASARPAPP